MDFSIKAQEVISTAVADEICKLIEREEINDLACLENGIREFLKEVGCRVYEKVLEKEDQKHGKEVPCTCGHYSRRISRRTGKLLTVFGWITYRRSYYGCPHCSEKSSPLDQSWDIQAGEVSPVMRKLLAIAGVEAAFGRSRRHLAEFLLT
jgi:hypothetical protein